MVNRVLLIPLSIIGMLLGREFRTHMREMLGADREYQRYWPCGCRAVYRDERDGAAEWSPCDAHLGWAAEH